MNRNLWVVLGTAVLFGLATGIYEFILPFLLKSQGIDYKIMGVIFALAGAMMVLVRIYMGGLADRWGRKHLYGLALGVCGIASGMAPLLAGIGWQVALKMLRETAALTRETIFPIVLYEERRGAFLNIIGKFRGIEFMLQAGGTLLAGLIVSNMGTAHGLGYHAALYLAGAALLTASLWWLTGFTERWQAKRQQIVSLRDLLSFDLHPNLRVILISSALLTFGVQLSHSFYMPLFYPEQFKATPETSALIMVLHRVTIALPLLVVGNLPIKNHRAWYIAGYLIEGLTMVGAAVAPWFGVSVGLFLLHDLLGAGIWVPIQAMLIQRYSNDATRGIEVGKVLAWSSLGAIAGPLAAGPLASMNHTYPFLFSGLIMMVAAIPLCWLKVQAPAAEEAKVPGAAV